MSKWFQLFYFMLYMENGSTSHTKAAIKLLGHIRRKIGIKWIRSISRGLLHYHRIVRLGTDVLKFCALLRVDAG